MVTRRAARKGVQNVQARYDAAGNGRRIRQWSPPSSGPQRAVLGLQKLRDRARDSSRNDWAGASSIQKWATNLIGVGITPRWEDDRFTKLWASHVPFADADGVLDAYGLQTLAVRSWFDSGEVFLRRRPRSLDLPLAAPVQYQLIEADYCPVFDADTWQGMPEGNTMRQGIERNKFGRRVAYWMWREHPGDRTLTPQDPTQLLRIPAAEIRHVFEPKRPGQMRGVSELAAVLVKLRASMDYEDATLDRQKLANLFVAFITRQMPDNEDLDFDADTGLPKFYSDNGTPMSALEPGTTQELRPGESVSFANPPEAGSTYSDYMRTTHVGTAAGGGLPYELMSGDIKDVSDRTLRVVMNEFRRLARQRQWQIVIPMLCQPMVDWWADALALKGDISLADVDVAKACKWSPEGWEYIHPTQDAEGKKTLIEAGIVSRSSVIAERGDDPRVVDAERKADKDRSDKLGLSPPEPAAPAPAAKPGPAAEREALETRRLVAEIVALERAAAPATAPTTAGPTSLDQAFLGLASMLAKSQQDNAEMMQAFVAHAKALAERPLNVDVAAPVVNLGDTNVTNEITTPTPEITVAVDVPATVVNVAPTPLTVVNEVQPATVVVELPARQTVSDIVRDRDGNITEVTQIETTLQ